jgi:hypothetical protein
MHQDGMCGSNLGTHAGCLYGMIRKQVRRNRAATRGEEMSSTIQPGEYDEQA